MVKKRSNAPATPERAAGAPSPVPPSTLSHDEDHLLELAEPVAVAAKIRRIVLANSAIHLSDKLFLGEPDASGINIRIRPPAGTVTKKGDNGRFVIEVRFGLGALDPEDADGAPLFMVQADFVLVYALGTAESVTDESLDAFAQTSGIFNAWPFWREYVLNTTSRMGLPPVTVPLYRI